MRIGMGSEFQILRTLPSGTELDILQVNETTGYSLARTVKNPVEGWVLTQYLSNKPIHRDRLEKVEKKLAALEKENAQLKGSSDSFDKQSNAMELDWKTLQTKNSKLAAELNKIKRIARNPVKISEENEKLKIATIEMEKEVSMLRQENQALKDRGNTAGWVTGAGILIAGLILGIIAPLVRGRRSGYQSL